MKAIAIKFATYVVDRCPVWVFMTIMTMIIAGVITRSIPSTTFLVGAFLGSILGDWLVESMQ